MPPPLVTPGFHHVTLVSRNAPRTLAFYRDLLGLEFLAPTEDPDAPGHPQLHFGSPAVSPGGLITFLHRPGAPRGGWGVGGVHHVALEVDDADALLRWKRRLSDAGLSPTGVLDRGYFQSLYFTDPDGQILELATRGPGYTIDEAADRLGEQEVVPDPERLPGAEERAASAQRTHPDPVPEVTPGMAIRGIHHVSGITDDIERAHTFYAGVLGLPIVKRTVNQDDGRTRHWFWARYDGQTVAPRSSMTLFGWPGSTHRARPGAGQTHHVAFRAGNDQALLGWQRHLSDHGVPVSEIQERPGYLSLVLEAPDGLLLEISTDPPGAPQL